MKLIGEFEMKDIYVLSYLSRESFLSFKNTGSFVVPINGFYRGVKIKDCKVIDYTKKLEVKEELLGQIAVMGITVLGIDNHQILGKLNTLKFF